MKVYVVGHTGLVGRATVAAMRVSGHQVWIPNKRCELRDIRQVHAVLSLAAESGVEAVVLAAARVGGIGANSLMPVEFYVDNVLISTNVISKSYEHGIPRLVNLGSSCIYPRDAEQPMVEDALLTGPLEVTNESYALAKIGALKLVQAYRRQYGARYVSLMPTNLYGDGDRYDRDRSHVIPSLICKFEEARKTGASVTLWGTGNVQREFLHADDLARAIVVALDKYDDDLWLNVGSYDELTIADLAKLVASAVGYTGSINWDSTKPDGPSRKKLDWSRMRSLGWEPQVSLHDGLQRCVSDFREKCGG